MPKHEQDIPYIFIHLYVKLREAAYNNRFLATKDIQYIMSNCIKIPPTLHFPTLFQMEKYGLVRRIHRMKYEILDNECHNKLKCDVKRYIDLSEEEKNNNKDEFKECIKIINKQGKIKASDESLYQIIPSNIGNKLKKLNVWVFE